MRPGLAVKSDVWVSLMWHIGQRGCELGYTLAGL